uniref:Chemokine interleukin-8-like domain-containing protein n=2 Tax=Ficedula albicollis TaxID=59894 RepID=A0A803VBT3_FICAL
MQHSHVLGNLHVQNPPLSAQAVGVHLSGIKHDGKQHQSGTSVKKKTHTAMDGKSLAVTLVLYLVSMAGLEGEALEKTDERGSQCQCISTHSKFIPPKTIQDVRISQRRPHCKNVEIIATLKDGREVCVEPTAAWVRLTVKALLARARDNVESPVKEKSRKNKPWISASI